MSQRNWVPSRAERDVGVRLGIVTGLAIGSYYQPSALVCLLWLVLVMLWFVRDVRRDVEQGGDDAEYGRPTDGQPPDFPARPTWSATEPPELPPRERWH